MNIDKTLKILMATGTVISGICAILVQLRDGPNASGECSFKINDCKSGNSNEKKN